MLPGCLASLAFADEVIVLVDAASTDRTAAIARKAGARVFKRTFDTFAGQKNFGIKKAISEWILIVDADERVTSGLAVHIHRVLKGSDRDGYRLKIINVLFGKRLQHGDWDEKHIRLIRKRFATYRGAVHEHFNLNEEKIGKLKGEIWHLSHRSFGETLRKTVHYSDLWAAQMVKEKHPAVKSKTLLAAPAKHLWRRLVRHAGWRDGITGVVAAGFDAFGAFYAFAALWNLQRKPSLDETYRKLDRQKW